MIKRSSPISSFLKEIAIVVIGVLIAVSISNFKEQQDDEAYLEKTLLAIENEVKQSEEEVKKALETHWIVIDSLQVLMNDEKESLGELLMRLGGIQAPDIKNIGLRFFISNKAELLDYQIISELYDIEDYTNSLDEKMNLFMEFVYENINRNEKDVKLKFVYYLANIVENEKALLELYDKFKNNDK